MAVENSFKIYTTSPLHYTERPFIVTTVTLASQTVPRADWYLATPNAPQPLVIARFTFDYDFEYYPYMDTDFLHKLLLEDALAAMRRRVAGEIGHQPLMLEDIQCQAESISIFLRYRIRGVFDDAINALCANLRHTLLRTELHDLLARQLPDDLVKPEI